MGKKTKYKNLAILKLSKIVHLLGKILGLVIKEQEGISFFNKIEKIRLLSKTSRGSKNKKKIRLNETKKFRQLKSNICKLSYQESLVISRSFSQFLNFSNLAESLYSVHKIHNLDARKAQGTNELVILDEAVERLIKDKSISKNKFFQTVKKLKIELVLTAHPTEVKRRTLIHKFKDVNNILERFVNLKIFTKKNVDRETKLLEESLHEEITSIWKTDELKRSKPTPIDEAKWGLAIIEDSLWNALPKICSYFDQSIQNYVGKRLPINFSPITFGSWMGGDRDGNSSVTSKITEEVVLLSRRMAANLYEKELTKLIRNLSIHECSKTLQDKVGNSSEPYRVFLRPIRDKMKNTQRLIELHLNNRKVLDERYLVRSINEVIQPLNIVYNSLCDVKCESIANGSVLDLLRRAHCFGLNLAKLDVRQEASLHVKLLKNICLRLGLGNYQEWSEEEKISFLSKHFKSKRSLIPKNIVLDKEDKEVWSTFQMIAKLPQECLGAYIISMASNVSDILTVMFLQKEAGIKTYLRVVPLFETLSDLQNAPQVIKSLYNISWYLKKFKHYQEVMIGYSDSSKDAGKLAASWAQYKAQENLQSVSDKYKVKLTLFHGRGGSVGRGGGPIYSALLSQPPGTVNGRTRVTEQGEIIQQKYSTESLAEHTLGTYIASVLEATLIPPARPKKSWRRLMKDMSETASTAYRSRIHDPNFLRYYRTITPQKILDQLSIGSRPTKRKKGDEIENLRAIPWVFSWTQIRFILPAWLGTLEGLELAKKGKNKIILKDMLNNWPFFYAMMDMLDMVLTKTDLRVIQFYEECLGDKELQNIGNKLRRQLLSLIHINKTLIPKYILEQRKSYRESIRIRNTYAETLNLLQADIMKKLKVTNLRNTDRKLLMDAMMVTIAGISAAMKNTG